MSKDHVSSRTVVIGLVVVSILAVAVVGLSFADSRVLPFLVVPVIASAAVGSTRVSIIIAIAAFATMLVLNLLGDTWDDTARQVAALVLAGLVSVILAHAIGRWRERLLEEQTKFRLLAENASDVVARLNVDGTMEWVSQSMAEVLGWEPTALVGTRPWRLVHPDDMADAAARLARASDPDVTLRPMLLRLAKTDGSHVWMSASAKRVADDSLVVSMRQVDDEVRAVAALTESEERFRLLAENATDLVFLADRDGALVWVSPSVTPVLGYLPEDVVGEQPEDLLHPDDVPVFRASVQAVSRLRTSTGLMRLRKWDGSYLWVEATVRAIRTAAGDFDGWVIAVRDVGLEHEARSALEHSLQFDSLTGLATRPMALTRVSQLLDAPGDRSWALLSLRIDGMTTANQAYSYAAGDEILRAVAQRLVGAAGEEAFVARIAGNEFLVLQRDIITAAAAADAAERFLEAVRGPVALRGGSIDVTACVGVALASNKDAEALLRDARAAMRQASQKGADRWEFLDGSVGASTRKGLEIQSELRDGLARGIVLPWFMPVVELDGGAVVGYEALVRWVLPDGSVRMPLDFLPMAERTGLILTLDLSILSQALDAAAQLPPHLDIGINLSSMTIASSRFVDVVRSELDRTGVNPTRVHLEVTETALVEVSQALTEAMAQLADIGIAWWVDDFGTGFSSISHLRDLPISGLKLDRSFTAGLALDDDRAARLAQGLVGLADGLGLGTVAEGVETTEQAAILDRQGWTYGQGWLYGKAAPLAVPAAAV